MDPPEPFLWNNEAVNALEFADLFFSFSENFPDDNHLLFDMSPAQISTMLET